MIASLETEEKCCPDECVQSRIWLQVDGQDLLHNDRDILQEGKCLNDRRINYAQKRLKMQFPCLEGLNLTLYPTKAQKSKTKGLQVIHCKKRDRWVMTLPVKQMRQWFLTRPLIPLTMKQRVSSRIFLKMMGKSKYPCRKCKSRADQMTVVFSL